MLRIKSGARGIAQVDDYLPRFLKAMNSVPSIEKKKNKMCIAKMIH
jgi:hypothetical protein